MKQLLKKAEKLALSEMKKFEAPSKFNFDIANKNGQKLAEIYKADKNIILLGTMLMDLKVGQALAEKRISKHTEMGLNAVKIFFKKQKVNKNITDKVIHCIKAHHGKTKYKSKEAEIVANADCYRFLTPKGFFKMIVDLTDILPKDNVLKFVEDKIEEKWQIISLPEVKKDLKPHYKTIKKLLQEAKKH